MSRLFNHPSVVAYYNLFLVYLQYPDLVVLLPCGFAKEMATFFLSFG